MSATEPVIAANQLRTAQARALAEAGIEHALWALAHPEAPNGLPDPLPTPVPPPYDGSRLIVIAAGDAPLGGFRIAVTAGASLNERDVLSIGWAPTDDAADPRPKAHQRVTGTLWRLRVPAETAPCALCVRGDLDVAAEVTVDARADARCGGKRGAWSSGVVSVAPSAKVWGADRQRHAQRSWRLRRRRSRPMRRSRGPSRMPTSSRSSGWPARAAATTGARSSFDASRPAPEGLVFVDTASGAPVTDVTPAGGARASRAPRGRLPRLARRRRLPRDLGRRACARTRLCAGRLRVSRHDAGRHRGTGRRRRHARRLARASLRPGGSPALTFDCAAASGGDGTVPRGWILKAGSYREPSDP